MTDAPRPPHDPDLESGTRQLYTIYTALRTADLTAVSATARRLQAGDPAPLRARLADELTELLGVVAGTHRHTGLPADAVLETQQVCYWTYLAAIVADVPYAALDPAACLAGTAPPAPAAADPAALVAALRADAGPVPLPLLRAALQAAGALCRAGGRGARGRGGGGPGGAAGAGVFGGVVGGSGGGGRVRVGAGLSIDSRGVVVYTRADLPDFRGACCRT